MLIGIAAAHLSSVLRPPDFLIKCKTPKPRSELEPTLVLTNIFILALETSSVNLY